MRNHYEERPPLKSTEDFDNICGPLLDQWRESQINASAQNEMGTLVTNQALALAWHPRYRYPGGFDKEDVAIEATLRFIKYAKQKRINYPATVLFRIVRQSFLHMLKKQHKEISSS